MQQPDPFDLFQPGITPAQNPGAQAGIQATPAAIQPATFGAQQQSALGSPDQLGPTDTNPAGLPTRPPSDATPNGVSFVPGGIQPMTFGRREIPWATPNAGPPAGLPAAPAMTPPAGGFGGAFGSPMKGGMGAGLRRIGQRLMPGLKRPRALRPIRPQGGAAQTGLTPQTPQF